MLPPPPQELTTVESFSTSDTPSAMLGNINPNSNEARPDPDPEVDCKCYMSVTSISNGSSTATNFWELIDGNSLAYLMEGEDESWTFNGGPSGTTLPTPEFELQPLSNGQHVFRMNYFQNGLTNHPDFTIHTKVQCCVQELDGSETLATTTFHNFKWSDGGPIPMEPYRRFVKVFSCLILGIDPPRVP